MADVGASETEVQDGEDGQEAILVPIEQPELHAAHLLLARGALLVALGHHVGEQLAEIDIAQREVPVLVTADVGDRTLHVRLVGLSLAG